MASRRPFADRTAATHQEISKSVHPSRPCKAGDLFHSGRGLQCGNCGAYTEDHGKTWEMAPEGKSRRSAADPVTDPQFVGDPAAHGMDKPIGGGFSIMQNLVKDQRQEMHEESKGGNPKMATSFAEGDRVTWKDEGVEYAGEIEDTHPFGHPGQAMVNVTGKGGKETHLSIGISTFVPKKDLKKVSTASELVKMATLRSRRAMYWSNPDRIYRLTKREIVDSSALCPRCRVEMSLEPYTKNDRMYCCSQCKFKIPKSNVIVASLKSRRSAVSAS